MWLDEGTLTHNIEVYVKIGSVHQRYSKHVMFFSILIGKEHQSSAKKNKKTAAAQQVGLIMAFMLLICSRESSQIQYVRSQLFISPRKTAKLCVECLHGLT